jgi:hypothetical protein
MWAEHPFVLSALHAYLTLSLLVKVKNDLSCFKGIVSRDEYFLRLIILNRYSLYMDRRFLKFFVFLVDEILIITVLAFSFEITY